MVTYGLPVVYMLNINTIIIMRIGYPEYMDKGYSWNKDNNRHSDK
jgi:hypothetical protein